MIASQSSRIVVTGHVDHGKSTLIGRLLHDTDNLPDGKAEEVEKLSKSRGLEHIEWSYVLDSFRCERDQAVSIDTTQIPLKLGDKRLTLIDAPGHREFLKNMLSGAAQADSAILIVDAQEGPGETTRTHATLLDLLGLNDVIIVINKMDLIAYDQTRFKELSSEVTTFLTGLGLVVSHCIPICARGGAMIHKRSDEISWYDGATLTHALGQSWPRAMKMEDLPVRLPVQDIIREGDARIITGRLESGSLRVGDALMLSHQNEVAHVKAIKNWPEPKSSVIAGEEIAIELDRKLFIERGAMLCAPDSPPKFVYNFGLRLFWLQQEALKEGDQFEFCYGTDSESVIIKSITQIADLEGEEKGALSQEVKRFDLAYVTCHSKRALSMDSFADHPVLGRGVLMGVDGRIVGAGQIDADHYPDRRPFSAVPKSQNLTKVDHLLNGEERAARIGHRSGVFWLTGLSASGKSTLAMHVEHALFEQGLQTYVLDGDNIRHGLNADLGFAPEDRAENIRRVGEVASLLADSGSIVMTSFISPYRADRERARGACKSQFHEIYIKADLAVCEQRDPKGLYQKARAGEISDFTGVDAPYEEPQWPDLIIDTSKKEIEECVAEIIAYIRAHV